MYLLRNLHHKAIAALTLAGSVAVSSAAGLAKSGGEYRFLNSLPGDQMWPQISLNDKGGYLVTQDNSIDGNGLGIRARKYYSDLSGARWTFQVNAEGRGEQQKGRVAVFSQGGAIFAWQGSTPAGNRVFVRALAPDETFAGTEIQASANPVGNQTDPAVVALADETALVAWAEWNRDGSMDGVFAQRFSKSGARLGATFQVNQSVSFSQRSPSLLVLSNGNVLITWIQEFAGVESIHVYGRIYTSNGAAVTGAFRLNDADRICANPALAATGTGFRAAWSSRKLPKLNTATANPNGFEVSADSDLNGWDIMTRAFDSNGSPVGGELLVNTTTKGDQFAPRLVSTGAKVLAVWTSYGQDKSDEGIFGRVISTAGPEDAEFQINTRTINKQIQPTLARAGDTVVVAWTSFMGGVESYDIWAQNYQLAPDQTLPTPLAPFVSSLSSNSVCVTWSEQISQQVDRYLVYVDNEAVPESSTSGMATIVRSWAPKSSHTFRLAYRTTDGRVSPLSDEVSVTTFGVDANGDGLPDDWQNENWGKKWPAATADSDGDGATNLEEFLAGTDPTDAQSVLRIQITPREQGLYVQWNTQPGNYYRLQVTGDFQSWSDVGGPRFAPSTADAVPVMAPGQVQYYRVIRMR